MPVLTEDTLTRPRNNIAQREHAPNESSARCFALIYSLTAMAAYAQTGAMSSQSCDVFEPSRDPLDVNSNAIRSDGRYCFDRDITVPLVRDWHAGGAVMYFGGGIYGYIYIDSPNTTLDLMTHRVRVKPHGIAGIICGGETYPRCAGTTIRNGRIETNSGSGILMRASNANLETHNVIENMHIVVSNEEGSVIGILADGAETIIRNNIIEVEAGKNSWTRVLDIDAPGALIENNLIIYKGPAGIGRATKPIESAPIILTAADGTIIRNNDIVIQRGLFGTPPKYAIGLFRSKGVVLENNRIYGADVLYKAFDEKSSVVDKGGNEFRSIFRRPWSHPKANAQ